MNKRLCIALLLGMSMIACTTTMPANQASHVSKRQAIDANAEETLNDLYHQAKGSRELVAKAKGVLVFPSVLTAGFMVGARMAKVSCALAMNKLAITKP